MPSPIKGTIAFWIARDAGLAVFAESAGKPLTSKPRPAPALTELRNRGVQDIYIACMDGLKGLPEALVLHIVRYN